MKTNEYLYGTNDVPEIPKEICDARLHQLQLHLEELTKIHWMNHDIQRINDVTKAQSFWRRLRDGGVV